MVINLVSIMELKSEKSIKEYLKKLSDDTIIKYYSDVEYSPFPVLVIEEYARRFRQKSKNDIIPVAKIQRIKSLFSIPKFSKNIVFWGVPDLIFSILVGSGDLPNRP